MKRTLFAIIFTIFALNSLTFADVKIRTRMTTSGQSFEDTEYIKSPRRRVENLNGANVTITQCDSRRDIRLNPLTRSYAIEPFTDGTPQSENTGRGQTVAGSVPSERGGTISITTTLTDTGERKQLFGYTARRVKSVMVYESSADACTVTNNRIETDGWYIDDDFGFDCGERRGADYRPEVSAKAGCRDKLVSKTIGTAKRGYAIIEEITMFGEGDEGKFTTRREVTELSRESLDPGLFEIPDGFTLVADASQLFRPPALRDLAPAGSTSGIQLPAAAANASTVPGAPKREGVIRIGLAGVKVASVGEDVPAGELKAAFEGLVAEYLKTPEVEVVLLESKLPSAQFSEARSKECDLILTAEVSHKKGGGGFGKMFGKVIAPAVGSVGIGHTGSVAGNIAGQAATHAIVSAGSVAANVKSKDEISFSFSLVRGSGEVLLSRQIKRKAKSNGEDLVTPVVEEAAEAVIAAVGK